MAYERVNWENLPSTNTPVNADNLNKIDEGIANAVEKSDLLNLIYPIGSVYISVNTTNPSTLFGGGWTRITGRFLLGADDSTYKNGNTGGEATHKLTIDEMPSHKHRIDEKWAHDKGTSGWGAQLADYNSGYVFDPKNLDSEMYNAGGDKAHNNMPPYLVVYMWKRTA